VGSRNGAPLILNLGAKHWVVNMTSQPLYAWERNALPTEYETGRAQSWSSRSGEEKNVSDLPEFKPQTIQSVA
jgi:hypothetical protein